MVYKQETEKTLSVHFKNIHCKCVVSKKMNKTVRQIPKSINQAKITGLKMI